MYQQLPSLSHSLQPLKPLKRNRDKKTKNSPAFDLRSHLYRITGVDLIRVDGLNSSTAQNIIADIGTDMSKWPTSKHFCVWLRVGPENKKTGGTVFYSSTKKTKNRANKALRMAAFALVHADCALGAFYRRVRAKHGGPAAITATAQACSHFIQDAQRKSRVYRSRRRLLRRKA